MCVHACELVCLRLLYPNIILRVHQATAWLGTFFWLKRQKEIDISSPLSRENEEGREVRCGWKWLFCKLISASVYFRTGGRAETPHPRILR